MERGQNCRNNFFECPFWCRECQMLLDGPCVLHGVSVKDKEAPENGLSANTSLVDYSLPAPLALANMDNDVEVREVIAKQRIGILTIFGPIVSPLTMTFGKQGLMIRKSSTFAIRYPNGTIATYDFKSPLTCNWMSQVRLEPNRDKANLMAFQHLDKVFFTSVKDIPAGSELRVAYSRIYACAIGKDSIINSPMNVEQKFFKCYNEDGFRHHDLHDLPSLYFPPGVTVPQYMVSISKPTAQLPSKTVEPASEELPVSDSDISEERSVVSPFQAEPARPQDASIPEYGPGSPEILPPPPKRLRPSTPVTTAEKDWKERSVSPEIPLPAPRPPKKPVDNALVAHPTGKRFKIPQPTLEKLLPKFEAAGRSVPLNASDLDPVRSEQSSLQQKVSQLARSPASQTSQASPVASPNRVVQNSTPVRFPSRITHAPVATTVLSVTAPSATSVLPPASHLPPLDPNALTAYYSGFLNALKQIPADIAPHQLVFNLPHPTDASRTHTIVLNPQQPPSVASPSRPMLTSSRPGGPSSLYPTPTRVSNIQWRPPNPLQPAPLPSGPSPSTAQSTVRTLHRPVELPVGPRRDLREPVLTSLLKAQQATEPSAEQQNTLLQTAPVQQVRLQYPQLQLRPPPAIVQAQPVRMVLPPLHGSTSVVSHPRLIAPNLTNQPGFHPLRHTVPGLPSNLKVVTLPPPMVKPSDGTTQTRLLAQSAQQLYVLQSPSGQSFLYNPSRQTMTPTSRVVSSIPQAQQNIVRVPIASTPPWSGQAPQTLRTLLNAPSPQTASVAVRKHCLGRKTITQPPRKNKRKTISETPSTSESETEEEVEAEQEGPRRVLRSVYRSKERTAIVDGQTESAPGGRRRRDSDPEWEPDDGQVDTSLEEDVCEPEPDVRSSFVEQEANETENDPSESPRPADEGLQVFRMVNDSLNVMFPGGIKERVEVKIELVDLS